MDIIPLLIEEMDKEAKTTRAVLGGIPDDKFDWSPHEKSMPIRRLANHIAELPGWVDMILTTPHLDFAENPYQPDDKNNTKDVLTFFEDCLKSGRNQLQAATEEKLLEGWELKAGDQVFSSGTKLEFIRHTYCQIVHHRAQMGVYLRLLDLPVPSSYGGSADDQSF